MAKQFGSTRTSSFPKAARFGQQIKRASLIAATCIWNRSTEPFVDPQQGCIPVPQHGKAERLGLYF